MRNSSEFELLGLPTEILHGIFAYGYHTPSQVQKDAIPAIKTGQDIVVQSKNGTGKTATFIIGALQNISPETPGIQTIILSPTRDLALQTHSIFEGLSKFTSITAYCAVGGDKKVHTDTIAIQTKHKVLIGTPGRILHLIKHSSKSFVNLKMLILDEADRMLDSGFGMQVKSIFDSFKNKRPQMIFVSATVPKSVTEMLELFLHSPQMFLVPQENLSIDKISQYYIKVSSENKLNTIYEILSTLSVSQVVIFANTKETVMKIETQMKKHEFPVTSIYSKLDQTERTVRMNAFFSSKYRILISTDISSRGIDAAHVNLVINYSLPLTSEEYLHRIGRGGRFGKESIAITLLTPKEISKAHSICGAFGKTLKEFPLAN
ncbi:ATP-dependent RNA helicase [Nematocida sp. AWRm80]|nr:ATP-dependent RNA helicase [Nematocida sp. AWRm80]